MKNEIVKYHNDLNSLSMRNWSAEEMDLFFSIVNRIQEQGTQLLQLNTYDLKILANSDQRTYRWVDTIEKFTAKAMNLVYREDTPDILYVSRLFSRFKYDKNKDNLELKVNDDFEYIVNKLTANFTVYELAEFTSLKSTYSKTMYRILKQWKSLGEKEFKIEQFRELLDVPEKYDISAITRRVINPIKKELPRYFDKLKVKAIKKNTQGTPVISYKFTWTPQKTKKNKKPKYINGKPTQFNNFKNSKKINDFNLYNHDNRMKKQEREDFVNRKLKQKLPIKKLDNLEEIKNIEGQVFIDEI